MNFGILVLLARLDPLLKLLKVLAKASELWVFKPSLRVESQRQNLEGVFADGLIISPHIDKDTFFVGQLLILLQFVVNFYWAHNRVLV